MAAAANLNQNRLLSVLMGRCSQQNQRVANRQNRTKFWPRPLS
jgi:hypothetical protein